MKLFTFLFFLFLGSSLSGHNNLISTPISYQAIFKNRRLHHDTSSTIFQHSSLAGGGIYGWFLSRQKIQELRKILIYSYQQKNNANTTDFRDNKLIKLIRKNLDNYFMHVPKLVFKKFYSHRIFGEFKKIPIYQITGWHTVQINNSDLISLTLFFNLFLSGAHFVIWGENNLLTEIKNLKQSAPNLRHSHYVPTQQKIIYPDITWQKIGKSFGPILCALLSDNIITNKNNKFGIFFQLEGWPYHAASDFFHDTYYHTRDFITHTTTIWNISTYGMSPYSEKRGTSIVFTKFQAPPPINKLKLTFSSNYERYAEDMR